jgi:hypothetical protein
MTADASVLEQENRLLLDKHILLLPDAFVKTSYAHKVAYLSENFCGRIITNVEELNDTSSAEQTIEPGVRCEASTSGANDPREYTNVYLTGNIISHVIHITDSSKRNFYAIEELSYDYNFDMHIEVQLISLGQVPINVHNVGVMFPRLFSAEEHCFAKLSTAHQFQNLTESNKSGSSYRNGIYLSKVDLDEEDDSKRYFNLLRCSTNFEGPTDNFREVDNMIVNTVNQVSNQFFEQETTLNHVLAQVYHNSTVDGHEKKARIKEHSDKTKDMPRNGLIAFCTFYHNVDHVPLFLTNATDPFDLFYKNASVLTKLRFRLKDDVSDQQFTPMFDVTLYPNSVFIIPLSTNRLYTHEIIPSHLPIDKISTRMGYVIRCSKTRATFVNNRTYIDDVELKEPTEDQMQSLKALYLQENLTSALITYADDGTDAFSLNKGDYMRPFL